MCAKKKKTHKTIIKIQNYLQNILKLSSILTCLHWIKKNNYYSVKCITNKSIECFFFEIKQIKIIKSYGKLMKMNVHYNEAA